MKSKEEIINKWLEEDVYGEPLSELDLNECGEIEFKGLKSGFISGYNQCQEDMQKDVEYWQGEFDHWHQQAMQMADTIKQAIEYGYQLRCNNKPINSGIDWVKEFNSLNKQDNENI
jgi:hypothetical protein